MHSCNKTRVLFSIFKVSLCFEWCICVSSCITNLAVMPSTGDITQKGYEKKRTKLLAPFVTHAPGTEHSVAHNNCMHLKGNPIVLHEHVFVIVIFIKRLSSAQLSRGHEAGPVIAHCCPLLAGRFFPFFSCFNNSKLNMYHDGKYGCGRPNNSSICILRYCRHTGTPFIPITLI